MSISCASNGETPLQVDKLEAYPTFVERDSDHAKSEPLAPAAVRNRKDPDCGACGLRLASAVQENSIADRLVEVQYYVANCGPGGKFAFVDVLGERKIADTD